jgi:tetratricopeptide (TPR) repeat protein
MGSRPVLSFALIASLSLGQGGVAARAAGADVVISVGQAADFSHIEFRGAQPHVARREGSDLVLRFGAVTPPDVTRLKLSPLKFLKAATTASVNGGTEIRLTLAPGADAKIGRADGATFVNLFAVAATTPAVSGDLTPAQVSGRKLDATPASGQVSMTAEMKGGRLLLHFPWRAPLGAAAFRRGDAIWLVFDSRAAVDLTQAPHGLPQLGRIEQIADAHATALRIAAPASTQAALTNQGAAWTLALGPAATPPEAVNLRADLQATPAGLRAQMAGATGVFWLRDPAVGDKIAVVTALGPAKGNLTRRTFVDAAVLASAQGLAFEPFVSDLTVTTDGDVVHVARPNGMALSAVSDNAVAIVAKSPPPQALPQPAAMPALVDFDGWSKTGQGGFLARYDDLQSQASAEEGHGKTASVQVRMGLARFLIGSELSFEAIGLLNEIAKAQPLILQDPQFRGLRGAARAIAGRYKDAEADFSSPTLAEDPASALWRGYVSQKLGDNAGARQQFAAGRSALGSFSPKWRARFARSDAEAALATNDIKAAGADLVAISTQGLAPIEVQAVQLDQARVLDAGGQTQQALALYTEVEASPYGALSTQALLRATQIQFAAGKIKPDDAVATLESLRFRWRGDGAELEAARALGHIYLSQGRYRDALETMRAGQQNLSELPAAVGIRDDLSAAFRNLFLDGGADGLPPIQAVGLFLDFKDLTPIGADGDMMVRKLARRLVDVDLLDQAAALLKYQADNRLDGVSRAEVDTDLALIQLMDKQPEQALDALNSSRTTLLPRALADRRRVLQARALEAMGRYDDALEFLGKDTTPDGSDLRAEIAWKQHDWAKAGALIEAQLGDRWKSNLPLGGQDQTRLIRCGVAYSLATDDAALARLRERYGKLADAAPNPAALKVALAGVGAGPYTAADYVRAAADSDAFAGWVATMKAKYLNATT